LKRRRILYTLSEFSELAEGLEALKHSIGVEIIEFCKAHVERASVPHSKLKLRAGLGQDVIKVVPIDQQSAAHADPLRI
jgi:hypothetical protein